MKKINTVAFDLGGVLAYQDLSLLTKEELILLKAFMNRNKGVEKDILELAKRNISEIYLKIHKLNCETITTLEMLQSEGIKASLWTNNIREIDDWFQYIGLYNYIRKENVVNSIYLGCDKPDIRFYDKALSILRSNPEDVLFFDDNYTNVISARNVGINAEVYDMSESLLKRVEMEIRKKRL